MMSSGGAKMHNYFFFALLLLFTCLLHKELVHCFVTPPRLHPRRTLLPAEDIDPKKDSEPKHDLESAEEPVAEVHGEVDPSTSASKTDDVLLLDSPHRIVKKKKKARKDKSITQERGQHTFSADGSPSLTSNPVIPVLLKLGARSDRVAFARPSLKAALGGGGRERAPRLRLLAAAQRADWPAFAAVLHEARDPVADCCFALQALADRREWWKVVQVHARLGRLGARGGARVRKLLLRTYAELGLVSRALRLFREIQAGKGGADAEAFELVLLAFAKDRSFEEEEAAATAAAAPGGGAPSTAPAARAAEVLTSWQGTTEPAQAAEGAPSRAEEGEEAAAGGAGGPGPEGGEEEEELGAAAAVGLCEEFLAAVRSPHPARCREPGRQRRLEFRPAVFRHALAACARRGDLRSGERALAVLRAGGFRPNAALYNSAILLFGACGDWERAVAVAEEMKATPGASPGPATWRHLLVACGTSLGPAQARALFDRMQLGGPVPRECYSGAVEAACVGRGGGDPRLALGLLREMEREAARRGDGSCAPGARDFDAVVGCCARHGMWREALDLLAAAGGAGLLLSEHTHSTLMSALRKANRPDKALEVFHRLRKRGLAGAHHPSCYTLAVCCAADQRRFALARSLLAEARADGAATPAVYGAAADAAARAGDARGALALVREMQRAEVPLTVEPVGAAIKACMDRGLWREALGLLQLLAERDVPGDRLRCFNMAIAACGKAGKWREALKLLELLKKAAATEGAGGNGRGGGTSGPDLYSYGAALAACARADRVEEVQALQREMEKNKLSGNLVTYNAVASVHRRRGNYRAILGLMVEMRKKGIQPDDVTYTEAMAACSRAGEYRRALTLWQDMRDLGLPLGRTQYGAAMSALAGLRHWREVLALIKEMKERGLTPEERQYRSALTACQKARQWDTAVLLLEQMRRDLGRPPGLAAHVSVITTCVQAQRGEEGYLLFRHMVDRERTAPTGPAFSIALLACRVWGRGDRAVALLREMAGPPWGLAPTPSCFKYALEALAENENWGELIKVTEYAIELGVDLGDMGMVFEIQAHGKLGNEGKALAILHSFRKKHGRVSADMLEAVTEVLLASQKFEQAFALVDNAKEEFNCVPRAKCYSSLLQHAVQLPKLEDTEKIYGRVRASMKQQGVRPSTELYQMLLTVLDKLGFADRVDKVYLEGLQNGRVNPWGRYEHNSLFLVQFAPGIAVHALKRCLRDMVDFQGLEGVRRYHRMSDSLLIIAGMPQYWQRNANVRAIHPSRLHEEGARAVAAAAGPPCDTELEDRARLQVLSTLIRLQFQNQLYGVTVDDKNMAVVINSQALKAWAAAQIHQKAKK